MSRVVAVIPCRDNPRQARAALEALAAVDTSDTSLRAVIVDDASEPPLEAPDRVNALEVRVVRLTDNVGGSGAFNAGIRAAMASHEPPDFVWLLDSDAVATPGALRPMVAALRDDASAIAAGSALRDPVCGHVYEAGGRIGRWSGVAIPCPPTTRRTVEYAAACSLLVRAGAFRAAGLFPELFLSHDDIAWCLEASRRLGGRVLAVPESIVDHPWQRLHVAGRYYASRNCWQALARRGPLARAGRAAIEVLLALSAGLEFGPQVARLHAAGWRDAAAGRTSGRCPSPIPSAPDTMPLDRAKDLLAGLDGGQCRVHPHLMAMAARLGLTVATAERGGPASWLASDLLSMLRRLVLGPVEGCVVAPAAWPFAWASRRRVLHVTDDRAALVSPTSDARLRDVLKVVLGAWPQLLKLAATGARPPTLPELVTDRPARRRADTP